MYRGAMILIVFVLLAACSDPETEGVTCIPETDGEICSVLDAACGTVTFTDRCQEDRTLSCGICGDGESCRDNVCECSPRTDAVLCDAANADCGQLETEDNCGTMRTANCGACPVGSECGSSTPNVCGCPCLIDQQCYPANAVNADNPCLRCVPSLSENSWSVVADSECDDGNACTSDDRCNPQAICVGQPKICVTNTECAESTCDPVDGECKESSATDGTACASDSVSCTDDVCIGGMCTHQIADDRCLIGNACYVSNQPSENDDCSVCDPTSAVTSFSPADSVTCDDGDALTCTIGMCNQGTCETQYDPAFCVINNTCVLKGERDPANPCAECDPAINQFAYTTLDGISCDDGDGLLCTQGICNVGSCDAILQPDWCLIANSCEFRGVSPSGSAGYCRVCDPDLDTSDWTPTSGQTCGQNGMCTCQNGACIAAMGQFCL